MTGCTAGDRTSPPGECVLTEDPDVSALLGLWKLHSYEVGPMKSVTILEVAYGKRNFVEQIVPEYVPSS